MAYQALYRTYRPQNFEDFVGQKYIKKTLQNAIAEKKFAHAYLFCGPRGTGKTTIARLLAKAINCLNPDEEVPCNHCENCISITAGTHPDVVEIDAASHNSVDDIRELIEKVKYAPISLKYKIYIIDEVHMMTPQAFNALLKTLEEPPSHVIFIMATTEPQKVLPTIISRSQRFDFSRVSEKDIVERLSLVLESENVSFEKEAISLIAQLADGGVRDSLSILEQCLAYSGKNLTVEDVNTVYGIVSMNDKIKLLLNLMNKNMKTVLTDLNRMNEKGTDLKRLTSDLIQILKDVVIYKNTNDLNILFALNESYIDQIVPFITVEECFTFINLLVEASSHYREAMDIKIYFELALMRICNKVQEQTKEVMVHDVQSNVSRETLIEAAPQFKSVPEMNIEEKKERVAQTDKNVFEQEQIVSRETPKDISEDGNIEIDVRDIMNILVQAQRVILEDIQSKWPTIKRYMTNRNTAKWASMLCDGMPRAACKGGLILAFNHQAIANNVNYYKNYQGLKKFLTEVLGEEYDFIAVTQNTFIDLRNSYLEIRQVGKLPKPQPIHISHIENHIEPDSSVQLTEGQKLAYELFGDLVEIIEE